MHFAILQRLKFHTGDWLREDLGFTRKDSLGCLPDIIDQKLFTIANVLEWRSKTSPDVVRFQTSAADLSKPNAPGSGRRALLHGLDPSYSKIRKLIFLSF
jgi:hypothetical protein